MSSFDNRLPGYHERLSATKLVSSKTFTVAGTCGILSHHLLVGVGLVATLAGASAATPDQSDTLLQLLVQKGILTDDEATSIRHENDSGAAAATASKWKISDAFKSIELYGDVRFRFEYRAAEDAPGAYPPGTGSIPDNYVRERFRYSLRLGIRGDLFDDFNYGVRIDTSSNPRSPWVTFGDDTSPTPSAKLSDTLGVGQVYLGWRPTTWYEMTIGKMPMPIYTTPMVWDSDINPEGAFEKFKFSYDNVLLFADFGQFVYQESNPSTVVPPSNATFILSWQIGTQVTLNKSSSFTIAPVLYNYTGQGSTGGLELPFVGQGSPDGGNPNTPKLNQNGINQLLILEVPAEYNLTLGKYHLRVFGDMSVNFNGDSRAREAYAAGGPTAFPGLYGPATGQNLAYQLGVGFGSAGVTYTPTKGVVYGSSAKKNIWEARVYWQHVEQYALDVNLLDSDFFEGRSNLEGVYTAVAYSFTGAIIGTVRYGHANPIDNKLGTGGNNSDLQLLNPIKDYNLVQVDLTLKF